VLAFYWISPSGAALTRLQSSNAEAISKPQKTGVVLDSIWTGIIECCERLVTTLPSPASMVASASTCLWKKFVTIATRGWIEKSKKPTSISNCVGNTSDQHGKGEHLEQSLSDWALKETTL
jgi:hypothetical protein